MPKSKTLEVLQRLRTELRQGTFTSYEDPSFRRWVENVKGSARNLFGEDSPEALDFSRVGFSPIVYFRGQSQQDYDIALNEGIGRAGSLLDAWLQHITDFWQEDGTIVAPGSLDLVVRICNRFHVSARRLRTRRSPKGPLLMEDEHDVQYLLGALLDIQFDDIMTEDWTPSYAGSASRIDFVLRPERIAIETKKTRPSLGAKDVGAQLLVDIARYEAHPGVDTLLCFVYDPDYHIDNPRGLERDLEKAATSRLTIRVIIRPQ